jgi:glycosyltransferase involved in cell wall biosynthesis
MVLAGVFILMADVGIVMPVYKQKPSYLRSALLSVLRQRYRHFVLVIVVDGITPGILPIVTKAARRDSRVKVLISKNNQGVASALNKGFKYLKQRKDIQYLTWVSSDNVYYTNFISSMRKALKQSPPQIGFVYSTFRHINRYGKPIHSTKQMVRFRDYQNQPIENLLDVCFVGVSFMYRKRHAILAGEYRKSMQPVEDYDYWLRLTDHCDIKYIPRRLMDYRVRSPFSISAQLQKSPEQHRRWRLAFQSSKHQARQRRGIPFETTVIFPVETSSPETVQRLEALLEQYYSNYKLIVVDASPQDEAISALRNIEDPRISYIQTPSAGELLAALREGIKHASTPFTLLYGKDQGPGRLQELVLNLRQLPDSVHTVYYDSQNSIQSEGVRPSDMFHFNRLYRTDILREMIIKKFSKQGKN